MIFLLKFIKKFDIIILSFLIIFLSIFLRDIIPVDYKVKAFTVSHISKIILMFLIPVLIFPFIVQSIIDLKSKGAYLIFIILALVFISNFFTFCFPYFLGKQFIPLLDIPTDIFKIDIGKDLIQTAFNLSLPPLLTITQTMVLGIIVGLIFGYICLEPLNNFMEKYYRFSQWILQKIFIPFLPIYMLGTILKITHEVNFVSLFSIIGNIVLMIFITQSVYVGFLFFLGSGGKFYKTVNAIKTAFPAGLVGFSTMSSLIAMPLTLEAAEKNTKNGKVAKITIGTTVNCHCIGECIFQSFTILMIIYMSTASFPDLTTYLYFVFFASFAQFSSVSIPGGSLIIMLPLLIQYLGFNDKMTSLMVSMLIFMEPIDTAYNILGNSAFVTIINRIQNVLSLKGKIKSSLPSSKND